MSQVFFEKNTSLTMRKLKYYAFCCNSELNKGSKRVETHVIVGKNMVQVNFASYGTFKVNLARG